MVDAEEITAYQCPQCDTWYESEYEAENCCAEGCPEERKWKCSKYNEIYDSLDEAESCCEEDDEDEKGHTK